MRLVTSVFLGLAVAATVAEAAAGGKSCEATVGVWDYDAPNRGRSIVSRLGDRFTFVWFLTRGPLAPASDPTTASEKAALYDQLGAGAAEFTCEEAGGRLRWKVTNLYGAAPSSVGASWSLDMELEDATARWWPLDADGRRGTMGSATRARAAGPRH